MDSIHEAHLSRILEGRRRRGVLGEYSSPVPLPPPPPPPPPPAAPPRRHSFTAATQTIEEQKRSEAAQTGSAWDSATVAPPPFTSGASGPSPARAAASDWRRSVPHGGGGVTAAAAVPPPSLTSPNPNATQDGAVRFESPGRVPSLAYSTPATSPRRRSSPWPPPLSAPPPFPSAWASPLAAESARRSVEPLPPPLFIRRARSPVREPLFSSPSFAPHANRRAAAASSSPTRWAWNDNVAPFTTTWRSRPYTDDFRSSSGGFRFSPLTIHRENGNSAVDLVMPWPSARGGGSSQRRRRRPSRHRTHHVHRCRHHKRSHESDDVDGDELNDREVDLPPRRRHSRGGGRNRSLSSPRRRDGDSRWGHGYAPPVVYMENTEAMRAISPSSSTEGASRRRRSPSPGSQQRRSRNPPTPRPVEGQRKSTLGLPDARSTMDLRTSIETLRAGDWFYKWSANGDVVHRRWVWVDTKSYLLVWSNRETRNPHFCGDIRLDQICQVTSRDLTSVDEDGFPKTYYVLLIETTKRVLQLATELKDKCDAWFEAMNNVMGFIHRNDIAKGALMPD